MSPLQPIPTPEEPKHKGISKTDVQALGLVLMILMVINLPLYHSVLQRQHTPQGSRVVKARKASVKIAFDNSIPTQNLKTDVPASTKKSGTSTSNQVH